MGRELQKKKNRSSIPKVRHKPKSKKVNIKGNPIVAANWFAPHPSFLHPNYVITYNRPFRCRDASQTLSQNYIRLGLTSKLNARAGGVEPDSSTLLPIASAAAPSSSSSSSLAQKKKRDSLAIPSQTAPKSLIPTTARVIRDPETGNILRVVHDDSLPAGSRKKKNKNPLNDPLNELESDDDDVERKEVGEGARDIVAGEGAGAGAGESRAVGGGIVEQLEAAAMMAGNKKTRPRIQSRREKEWIEALMSRWGENYRGMMTDRRLNPMQQSEGDLRRRIERWKNGHGNNVVEASG